MTGSGGPRRSSLSAVSYQLPRADFAAVHIALRVHRAALRSAGPLHLERVGNAVEDVAVLDAADPDAPLPPRVRCNAVRFRVGHIDRVVPDVNAARAAELMPFGDERSVLIEDLDAHVAAVGDEEPSLRVHGEVVRRFEFDRPRAELAERFDKLAVRREFRNP